MSKRTNPRKRKPTALQKRAVDNIVSGKFENTAAAMREAGYSKTTSLRSLEKLGRSKGVETYLNGAKIEKIVSCGKDITREQL